MKAKPRRQSRASAGKGPKAVAPARKRVRRDAGRARGEPILEAVLKATVDELAQHGFDGLSVDRIARAAEVNKTSVYRRWPTREALVAAAMEGVIEDVDGVLTALPSGTAGLRGQLMAMAQRVAGFLGTPGGRALALAAIRAADAPELAAMARRLLEQGALGPVAEVVMGAMQRGEWRPDLDPVAVLNMLVGAMMHRSLLERRELDEAWLSMLVGVVVRGVAPVPTTA